MQHINEVRTVDRLLEAKNVFDTEITALEKTRDALDDTFLKILDLIINCEGKVIITGMGKPGHIAAKLAATFSSLGASVFCFSTKSGVKFISRLFFSAFSSVLSSEAVSSEF